MIINQFKNIGEAYMFIEDMNLEVDWDELVTELGAHQDITHKEGCGLFNLWEFDPNGKQSVKRPVPNTVGRTKDNAVRLHGLVIDIDDKFTIEETIERYKEIEFFIYTTFSHTAAKHKFRVVVPFSRPIDYEDYQVRKVDMSKFFSDVDKCTFAPSHSFYWHSSKQDHVTHHNKGLFVDPYWFEVEVIEEPDPTPTVAFTGDSDRYKRMMIDSLEQCTNVRYPEGLLLASLCKSAGFSFAEFNSLAFRVAGHDSVLRAADKRKLVWDDATCDKVTKRVRNRFFEEHGVVKKDWDKIREEKYNNIETAQERKARLMKKYTT